jgi:hypothetical protein
MLPNNSSLPPFTISAKAVVGANVPGIKTGHYLKFLRHGEAARPSSAV